MRFPREQRLRHQTCIETVRRAGKRYDCGAFYFFLLPRPLEEGSRSLRRVTVVASRRIGNAVARNRAKRRLRHLFMKHQCRLPLRCDMLLVARIPVLNCKFGDLERRFAGACRRIPATEQKHVENS